MYFAVHSILTQKKHTQSYKDNKKRETNANREKIAKKLRRSFCFVFRSTLISRTLY